MMQWNGLKKFGRAAAAGLLIAVGGVGLVNGVPVLAQGQTQAEPGQDMLIFANGTVMYGKIVSETASSIRFKGKSHGLEFETEYQKANILEIKRAKDAPAGEAKPAAAPAAKNSPRTAPPDDDGIQRRPYYWITLNGGFGTDISQTPIRQAIKDAKEQKAEVIIIELDASWKDEMGEELPDDTANFNQIFRAEDIVPIIVEEVPRDWENPPKIVVWVKQAMGGAALMPLVVKDIYFSSNARMGGLGDLSLMFARAQGDKVVHEKLMSARLGHAQGWAIAGGHDPRLVDALALIPYTLSVTFENGEPVLYEGMPRTAGDELLTDDGRGENFDTVEQRVRGETNDVLTLNARTARLINFSKGTIDTREQLLRELNLDRVGKDVSNRSERILSDWSRGLENAQRQLRRLLEDFAEVRVMPPGDFSERTKARGQRLRIIEQMIGLLRRWGEGLDPYFLYGYGIPSEEDLNIMRETIKLEQLKDRK